MPKAKPGELAALREEVLLRDGGCLWPGCDRPWNMPLELASRAYLVALGHERV